MKDGVIGRTIGGMFEWIEHTQIVTKKENGKEIYHTIPRHQKNLAQLASLHYQHTK